MKLKIKKILICLSLITSNAFASGYFYTGNDFRNMSLAERRAFVAGAVDSITLQDFKRNMLLKEKDHLFSICPNFKPGITLGQLERIVSKWIEDNPAKAHWSASSVVEQAIGAGSGTDLCKFDR